MKKTLFLFLFLLLLFSLCVSGCAIVDYTTFYKLDDQYLERRQLETKFFETDNEEQMLISSVQVLQDLGYIISESNMSLGIVTGSKQREAGSDGQKAAAILALVFLGVDTIYDVSQDIYVTLVSTQSKTRKGYNIRVEFASIIYNNKGGYRVVRYLEPEIYKEFFDKLSQSVFLTANDL